MPSNKSLFLVGYASGIAGAQMGSAEGPFVMQHSAYLAELAKQEKIQLQWQAMIKTPQQDNASKLSLVHTQCTELAQVVASLVEQKKFFAVLGGDHTSALGTWSGAYHATQPQGPIGLIWIDAHMDSHTPETSLTGNLHGMPLASLLGYGASSLVQLLDEAPKLMPAHICLIGVRSYEPAEMALLQRLHVRVFTMEEVKQRGLAVVLAEAIQRVTEHTVAYGMSLDIDSIDPQDAPGTGVPEVDGLAAKELSQALTLLHNDPRLLGIEIVEFDPQHDRNRQTEQWITRFIASILLGEKV